MFTNWASIVAQPRPGDSSNPTIKPPAPFKGLKVFPRYTSTSDASAVSFTPPADQKSFYSYIQKIKKATDVTTSHLDTLGVSVEYDFPVEKMLPEGNWFPGEDDKTFSERKRELLVTNDDAFDVLSRKNKEIKLGHMYRFFQAMELIKSYYPTGNATTEASTSLNDGEEKLEQGCGKRKAEEEVEGGVEKKGRAGDELIDSGDISGEGSRQVKKGDKKEKPEKFTMPEKFREELVKNFIEPICWGYGVRVYAPRGAPIISVQKSRFLVHLTNYVYLTPKLPAEARAGLVEGPVMGVQVRHETRFRPAGYEASRKKKRLAAGRKIDILEVRELGVDKMDIDDDKDKDEDEDEDDTMLADDVIGIAREIAATLSIAQDRRKGPRPDKPEGKTERKIRYRAIGKGEKWRDDIFIMTSLHHHVSISHISVSQPYLRFLETGKLPNFEHEFFQNGGQDWDKLKIQKTQFWDLLDPKERAEAAHAICGVLNWLSREETKR